MDELIKKAVRFLRLMYVVFWALPVATILAGEWGTDWVGMYADDVRVGYLAETVCILLVAVCVPVSMKVFAWILHRKIDRAGMERALQLYVFWSGLRLILLVLPLLAGFLTYYAVMSTTGLLCGLIALTASLFCWPGGERLRRELNIDRDGGEGV